MNTWNTLVLDKQLLTGVKDVEIIFFQGGGGGGGGGRGGGGGGGWIGWLGTKID